MRRFAISLACVFMLGASLCLAQSESPNLVRNPSLDEELEGRVIPRGWSVGTDPPASYRVAIVDEAFSGMKSLRIEGDGRFGVAGTNLVEIDRNRRYTARAFVRAEGDGAGVHLKLQYHDADGQYIDGSYPGHSIEAEPGWEAITISDRLYMFPQARFVSVGVALTGKGKAWVDDLELVARESHPNETNLIQEAGASCNQSESSMPWFVTIVPGGRAALRWTTDKPKEGRYCLRLLGKAQWISTATSHLPYDRAKTYTLTGSVRVKSGRAKIGLGYFREQDGKRTHLGSTVAADVTANEWTDLKVIAEPDRYPTATHIVATAVGNGEVDASFDGFVLTAK